MKIFFLTFKEHCICVTTSFNDIFWKHKMAAHYRYKADLMLEMYKNGRAQHLESILEEPPHRHH